MESNFIVYNIIISIVKLKMNGNFDVNAFAEKLRKPNPKNAIEQRFKVFISHSSEDTVIACELRNLLVFIPEMDVILDVCNFEVGEWLPERIKEEIKESDCFVVFLTKNAEKSVWVNQEIGVAINTVKIIPIVEEGVCLGLLEGMKHISFGSKEAIIEAFSAICEYQTAKCLK